MIAQRLLLRGLVALAGLLGAALLHAQGADAWRGGWIADVDGTRHIYYLVLRDGKVSGFYCTDCANPAHLAFVDDGRLDASGLHFSLFHNPADGRAYAETVNATLQNGNLVVIRSRAGRASGTLTLHRVAHAPPGAVAEFRANRPADNSTVRQLPAAAEDLNAKKVAGVWLWGTGPTKQYFIFRPHKNGLRGMVCGPCDSVIDMAPLEGISVNGTKLHFDIVHEDNGIALEQHGPHANVTDAVVSRNEMHLSVIPSYEPPTFTPFEMTLLGPVRSP